MRRFFTKVLWNFLLNVLALAAVIFLLRDVQFAPGITALQDQARALLVVGGIVGLLNVTLKPLMTLLSLPVILVTVGLFLLVINTFIFYVAVNVAPWAVVVTDVSAYFWGAILFSIVNTIEHTLFPFKAKA